MVVLGSSLRETPASLMASPNKWEYKQTPFAIETVNVNPSKLVIVNLQKTHAHEDAHLAIFSDIDIMFENVMKKLDLKIKEFKLERWLKLTYDDK